MEIRSIKGESYISLTQWEADDYGVKVAIAVRDGDFTGAYDEVWFFRDAFAAFIEALRNVSLTHEGEAKVESMSPGEAIVSIRRLDMARHLLVEVQVARWRYVRGHSSLNRVVVAFEPDPMQLPDVIRSLAAVIAEGEPL